jgi:hypothetical protein
MSSLHRSAMKLYKFAHCTERRKQGEGEKGVPNYKYLALYVLYVMKAGEMREFGVGMLQCMPDSEDSFPCVHNSLILSLHKTVRDF